MPFMNWRFGKQTEDAPRAFSPVPEAFHVLIEEKRGPVGAAAATVSLSRLSPLGARCSFLKPVFLYLVACLLLYTSWWCTYSAAKWPIAYAGTARGSALAQGLLWWSALLLEVAACEFLLLRLLVIVPLQAVGTRMVDALGRQWWCPYHRRCAAAASAATAAAATAPLLSAGLTAFYVFLLLVPFIAQCLIWAIVRGAIPRKYYQTYEVVYTLTRCLYDLLFLSVVTVLLCMRGLNRAVAGCRRVRHRVAVRPPPLPPPPQQPPHQQHSRERCSGDLAALLGPSPAPPPTPSKQPLSYYYPSLLLLVLLVSTGTTWFVRTAARMDAAAVMRGTVLGDSEGRNRDFCAMDGGTLDYAALQRAWVLPELLPRRFFNFYSGSTQCAGRVRLAYLDEGAKQLVLTARCPSSATAATTTTTTTSSLPRVFLNLAAHNALAQTDMGAALEEFSDFVRLHYPNRTLQEDVLLHYVPGSGATSASPRVLQAVELRPSRLLATRRPLTPAEQRRFPTWGPEAVTVPLGQVVSYVVRCEKLDHEEVWVYPLDRAAGEKGTFPVPHSGTLPRAGAQTANKNEHTDGRKEEEEEVPPMNLLVLMLDAVSRPEVLRSLPKWRQWLRDFQQRQARRGAAGHLVVEARAHTTIDHSTRPNLLSTLAGAAEVGYNGVPLNDTPPAYKTSVFTLAKARYGSRLHTALLVGYCEDYLKLFFRYPNATFGGFGSSVDGVDAYVFGPFCERRYAAMQSNFYGPYSVVRRCLGNLHVHEMVLDYTRALVRQQLERVRASRSGSDRASAAQEAFLHFATLIDGHEGTHGVLYLLDEALTAFMRGLEEELHFFDDRRNGLLLFSDHGNHMGPYYMTYPGQLERALPFLVLVVHPSVLDTVDRHKGRGHGTAQTHLLSRTKGFTSSMDIYLTLCDLLHVPAPRMQAEAPPSAAATGAVWYPFSLLDALPEGMVNQSHLSRSRGYRAMYGALPRASRKQAAQFCDFDV